MPLRQELHWHLGRLALGRLQHRLRYSGGASSPDADYPGTSPTPGRTPLLNLARDAEESLQGAIELAQAARDATDRRATTSAKARMREGKQVRETARATSDDTMRAREGWARAELGKVCLAGIAPEHVRVAGYKW